MKLVSWLVGSKPKSPELKEAEAAFSETERKDIEAHYNAVYKQFQAAYLGGRGAAPKGLDARHLGLLVGPLWGCLEPLLAADVFALLASPDDGLVHLEQLLITKAKLERLGEDACLDTTFRMLDVHREGALRADALAAGMVSGVRMSLAAAAAVNAAAAGPGAGVAAGAAGAGGLGVAAGAKAAVGAGSGAAEAGAGQGGAAAAQEVAEQEAAVAIAAAVKALDGSSLMQQALAVCRGALLPQEPASSSSPSPSSAAASTLSSGGGWTPELKSARMSSDEYRRWSKRCPALHKALAGLLRHVGSAPTAAAATSGTASGTGTPGQGLAAGGGQGRGGGAGGGGGGGGPTPTTPNSSGGSPHSQASAALAQQYRHELPPVLAQLGKLSVSATLLQPVWMWLLSARLPPAQRCEWRLLFSSARDGKSFNTFFGRVSATPGPTLLLIRDKGGALFGGYASQPWAKSGNFYGDVSCAIFSLLPAVQVYPATGINDNIQWCGVGFSQLPGGLGFGGAAGARGHFALYVEPSLDSGMSRPIATFGNSSSLASEQVFQIDTLECWLLQPPEDEDAASGSDNNHGGGPRRGGGGSSSILDKAAEDRAIMKMAGMNLHSEGVRDEPLEED